MAIKSDGMSDLDKEILQMELERRLNGQENALLTAKLEIKKAERAVQKYRETIDSLEEAIAETKSEMSQIS